MPTFRDTTLFHHAIRVGKKRRRPQERYAANRRPTHRRAIVVTKVRTMEPNSLLKSTNESSLDKFRKDDKRVTKLGRVLRVTHLDELPQIIDVLKGTLRIVSIRPLLRKEHRQLPQDVRKIYDEVGPGLLGLQYSCTPFPPTDEQFFEQCRKFYKMWKTNKSRAYTFFGSKIVANILLLRARTR
ncbi:MAG: sugar transferase [Candidatus Diapherotrites archaeon]|nr:sugar transferase [Candidatus Diapherotrites archaeon]